MWRTRAFTLIELLVVVAIIAILISILMPALSRARKQARRTICMSNLHTMGIGVHCYETAFNGVLPWEGYAEGDRPIRHLGPWQDGSQWFNAIPEATGYPAYYKLQDQELAGEGHLPKQGDRSHFVCPDSEPAAPGPKDDLVTDGYFMLWGLDGKTNALDRRKTYWSYGYNTELDAGVEDRHTHEQVFLTRIKWTAETPIIVEKLMRPDEHNPPFLSGVGQAAVSWKESTTRHDGGGYILMLDGHVGWFSRRQLLDAPGAPSDYNQPGKVIWNPGGPAN